MKELIGSFDPGYFAFVMATGIVSIGCHLLGMEGIAGVLFLANKAAWIIIVFLALLRLVIFPSRLAGDTGRDRGPSLFTVVPGACILGDQFVFISNDYGPALGLWIAGLVFWVLLIYAFFTAVAADGRADHPVHAGFGGEWLIFVVGTQAVSVLGTRLAKGFADSGSAFLFISLCMYLIGAMLYIVIIGLIFYRMFFFAMPPERLSPAYWINMGAAAITTLSGALLLQNAGRWDFLSGLAPFLRGFTLFFWAAASWWIPLLAALNAWKYFYARQPLSYDVKQWSMVFPLGMYTVCTYRFSSVSGLDFLAPAASWFIYAALAAWAAVFIGMLKRLLVLPERLSKTPLH